VIFRFSSISPTNKSLIERSVDAIWWSAVSRTNESSTLITIWRNKTVEWTTLIKEVCIQLPTLAVNVALLAFAAERRAAACAAAPLLLGARRRSCQSISPAETALSNKPASSRGCSRMMGQTDRRTDARSFHRPCSWTDSTDSPDCLPILLRISVFTL